MVDYTFAITGSDLSGPAWKAFVDNVKKANDQVAALGNTQAMDKFGSSVESIKGRVDALVGAFKGVVGLWAGNEAVQWAKRTAAAADETQALGKAMGFTADQIQAMQIAAAKNGTTLDEQAAFYGKNRALLDEMTESMRRQGQIMAGPTRQGFADVNQEMEKVGRTWDALRASFGDTGMIGQGLGIVAAMIRDVGASLAYVETYRGTIQLIREIGAIVTGGGGLAGVPAAERAQQFLGGLKKDALEAEAAYQKLDIQVRALERDQATAGNDAIKRQAQQIAGGGGTRQLADLTAQRDEARKARDETKAAVERAEAAIAKAEAVTRTAQSPPYISTGKTADQLMGFEPVIGGGGGGGGGGGRTDDDMLEAQIKRYDALKGAATSALSAINAQRGKSLEDMQREVNVQRQIDEIVGKLGAKYTQASDAQKERLRAAVSGAELEKSAVDKLMQAEARADATERQYGNGQLVLLTGMNQLEEARNTGRMSIEAYDNATKILTQSTEDLRLKNLGLQGGLTGFGAGWQNAQNQFERANNAFAMGGAFYNQMMNTMTLATQSWGQSFDQILLNAGASWARFLATMAMQAAASSVWSVAGPALGSIVSGIAGALFGGYSGTAGATELYGSASSTMGSLSFGGPRAGGGPVMAGQGYIVGENGPEWFQPTSGGNILNNQQLAALGVGGGGGGDIHVHLGGVTMGRGVSHAEMRAAVRQMGEQVYQAAQRAMIDQRRRGVPSVKGAFG